MSTNSSSFPFVPSLTDGWDPGQSNTGLSKILEICWGRPSMSRPWSLATWEKLPELVFVSRGIPILELQNCLVNFSSTRKGKTSWQVFERQSPLQKWKRFYPRYTKNFWKTQRYWKKPLAICRILNLQSRRGNSLCSRHEMASAVEKQPLKSLSIWYRKASLILSPPSTRFFPNILINCFTPVSRMWSFKTTRMLSFLLVSPHLPVLLLDKLPYRTKWLFPTKKKEFLRFWSETKHRRTMWKACFPQRAF
mmetsp:Transcript_10629/g.26834  ORF Transcript_10629/g.26834 Transcript_10629/m.26834 type:complete len:250 (-) Transcript_10629:3291-4040(-)